MIDVFILGSRGIPAKYGGFETFVDKLTENSTSKNIKYHVSCRAENKGEFEYNNARCFNVKIPNIGSAQAIYYDFFAIKTSLEYIEKNNLKNSIIYILGCSIGPFLSLYMKKIKKLNVKLFINPDGLEHKRLKWNNWVRKYLKYSEKTMVKYADLVVCDSLNIEKYIKEEYKNYNPNTEFIAYGAELKKGISTENIQKLNDWYNEKGLKQGQYYLSVGRFVPENNYETMIREFMKSNTKKDFAIITNYENNKFYEDLKSKTNFQNDKRIKFVGTVYNQELLVKIRENAYGYIHGHEVGGTNPSLLEALATTKLNLLLGVGFNREVADEAGFYWSKKEESLSDLINQIDFLSSEKIENYSQKSKDRIKNYYNWPMITQKYEKLFEDTSLFSGISAL